MEGANWNIDGISFSEFIVEEAENSAFNPPVDPDDIWFINQSDPKLLLTPDTLFAHAQTIEDSSTVTTYGEMAFSPDGSKLARFDLENGASVMQEVIFQKH